MESMRNQINDTVNALQTLLQKLQEVQSQAQATIAAVQAAAAMSAANGYNSGISGDYGNYDSDTTTGSKNPGKTYGPPAGAGVGYHVIDMYTGKDYGTFSSQSSAEDKIKQLSGNIGGTALAGTH